METPSSSFNEGLLISQGGPTFVLHMLQTETNSKRELKEVSLKYFTMTPSTLYQFNPKRESEITGAYLV